MPAACLDQPGQFGDHVGRWWWRIGTTGRRLQTFAVKAAAGPRVAGNVVALLHGEQQSIGIAVVAQPMHLLVMTGRGAFVPELLPRAAPVVGFARCDGAPEAVAVHPRHHQHRTVQPVLGNGGDQAGGIKPQLLQGDVQRRRPAVPTLATGWHGPPVGGGIGGNRR